MRDFLTHGPHWTYGFLRRPELDTIDSFCYEAPNGDLLFSQQLDHIHEMTLFEVIDENGERFLCDKLGLST